MEQAFLRPLLGSKVIESNRTASLTHGVAGQTSDKPYCQETGALQRWPGVRHGSSMAAAEEQKGRGVRKTPGGFLAVLENLTMVSASCALFYHKCYHRHSQDTIQEA